eukprot:CAMPEP_0185553454 /NCGR_PEP_ID=MMETSP1381-20130426/37958_1 /TAXON_ID=298111 /ORGANISM="Pavlova sp., Strain CCMP459" /LENGTH=78 /DNA_ID=CAMNT_0028166567 /DNA_START=246 /DNA_END=479 /DNA_ORIENTATION=+
MTVTCPSSCSLATGAAVTLFGFTTRARRRRRIRTRWDALAGVKAVAACLHTRLHGNAETSAPVIEIHAAGKYERVSGE